MTRHNAAVTFITITAVLATIARALVFGPGATLIAIVAMGAAAAWSRSA